MRWASAYMWDEVREARPNTFNSGTISFDCFNLRAQHEKLNLGAPQGSTICLTYFPRTLLSFHTYQMKYFENRNAFNLTKEWGGGNQVKGDEGEGKEEKDSHQKYGMPPGVWIKKGAIEIAPLSIRYWVRESHYTWRWCSTLVRKKNS